MKLAPMSAVIVPSQSILELDIDYFEELLGNLLIQK